MNCFLVSYDLLTKTRDYGPLYAKLKEFGAWWHHLESVWIITTEQGIKEVSDQLKALMDDQDSLLVVDISGRSRRGWLTERAWNWLNRNHPVQPGNTTCGSLG